jgi:hypothetical protein
MNQLTVTGKGVYIWQPDKIGTPDYVANLLKTSATDFVALKIHDGSYIYEVQPYIDAIREAGIKVGAWGYVYLKWNAAAEAIAAVRAINRYQPEFYLLDAEAHAKGQQVAAMVYARTLRFGVENLPIGLNTYWKPSYHQTFPFWQLRSVCDFDCPQVYWRNYGPVTKLKQSKLEYGQMTPKLPMSMAAGDMYSEFGLKPTPAQVIQFLDACRNDSHIQAAVMWSLEQRYKVPELWDAYASYRYCIGCCEPTDPVVPPARLPLYAAVVTPTRGLVVRATPNGARLYAIRRGDRVEVWAIAGDWAALNSQETEWVHASYLSKV